MSDTASNDPEPTEKTEHATREDTLDLLVLECVERCDRDGPEALAAMCREHPEFAANLRNAVAPLLDIGVCDSDDEHLAVTDDAVSRDVLGSTIGGYEIVRELGRGGMGIVFEARDPELDRSVALKLLRGAMGFDDESRERFRREAASAGSLQHENLVRVFGYGMEDGCPWLAMEFIADAPLDRAIALLRHGVTGSLDEAVNLVLAGDDARRLEASGGPQEFSTSLSPREVRRRIELILEVAGGLHFAHQNGIVHRDVKPSNILVREDGRPVLTDFGLAVSKDLPQLTREGSFAGTPFYASPEQAAGRLDEVDAKSDVFALGVTLYELITLRRPFDGPTSREVLTAIERDEPLDPTRCVPGVADDLAAITLKALAKDRRERYADMQAFADDLRAFLELRPVTARRASGAQRLQRWIRREPLRAALAAVLSVGGLVVAGVIGFAVSQQPLVRAAEEQRREDDAEQATIRGFVEMRERNVDLARAAFDAALAEFPDKATAVVGRVMTEVTPNSGDRALALLQRYLDKDPNNPVWLRLQCLCLDQSKRYQESAPILAKLGEPELPLELFLEACSRLRDVAARDDMDEDEISRAYRDIFALFNAAIAGSEHPVPIYYYYQANMVVGGLRDAAAARRLASSLVRLWPDQAFAWRAAGEALEPYDPEEAGVRYAKAQALAPKDLRHRIRLADNLFRRGENDRAEAELQACLRLGAKDAGLHEALARLHATRGDFEGAISHAQEAVAISRETNITAWVLQSRLLIRLLERVGKADEAIAYAKQAIAEQPQLTGFHEGLIDGHLRAKEFDAADALSKDMIDRAPDDPYAWYLRGRVFLAQGKFDETLQTFRKCCELDPKDVASWSNLAKVLGRRKEHFPEAVRAARKAVELSKFSQVPPLQLLATRLLRSGKLAEAEHYFRMGLDLESLRNNRDAAIRGELERGLEEVRGLKAKAADKR